MLPTKPSLRPTRLQYKNPRTPYSEAFDDTYFSAEDGIEESKHVYLEGVGLVERINAGVEKITVGEIGFGVGLNFVLTLKTFLEHAKPGQHLTYISAEKNPILKEDLVELYSRFPELNIYAKEFLKHYPLLTPGFHWIRFPHHPISLLLLLGEATEQFSKLEASIDLWYWDGFAPSRNPDAFSEALIKQVVRLSAPGARGASFTSAGWVRRLLETSGFKVEKRTGFGSKRECIVGTLGEHTRVSHLEPWFSSEALTLAIPGKDRIGIIGAGLAGTALAQSFNSRGFDVHLIDQFGVAERASSNDLGLYNVQLSKDVNPLSRFAQLSLAHFLRELKESGIAHRNGIFKVADGALECLKSSEYPEDFYETLTAEQASERAEVRLDKDGIFFPECGVLNPKALSLKRLRGSKIYLNSTVHTIKRHESPSPFHFTLLNEAGEVITEVDHLIYATGADTPYTFPELAEYSFKPVRGQTIQVKPTDESRSLQITLFDRGYITPIISQISGNPLHLIGATYQGKTVHEDQMKRDEKTLLHEASSKWSFFKSLNRQHLITSKEGFRLSTPDKLPLMGPLADFKWMKKHYEKTLRGAAPKLGKPLEPLKVLPREWMFLAFGSRGITFTSYGAEILANLMCGDVLPVENDLWEHLHSARFFVRKLKKPSIE